MPTIYINPAVAVDVLNRLLHILCRSLAMYLSDARPWADRENMLLQRAIDNLAFDQRAYAQRVSEAITELDGRLDPGGFPTWFTSIHDLSLGFLFQKVIELHRLDLSAIEQCVAELDDAPALRSLAEEILGNAKGHLEILEKKGIRD